MLTPAPASPTPIADPAALATLMLSRGKYFLASKVDATILPDEGDAPYPCAFAGVVRDRTPDAQFFLVDIFGSAYEFKTDEKTVIGQRIMSLSQLMKATFYPEFAQMQAVAAEHAGFLDSLHID